MNKSHANKKLNQLPSWLWTNSTTLPPVYKMVWEAVREDRVRSNGMQTELLVDTNKVFPLLLTSQLPTEVLGHIWSLANQKYAGQLTEQELYIVLALVAAAQTSYTFNSLDILHLLPFPPTPYLNIECLMNLQPAAQANASKLQHYEEPSNMNIEGKYIPETKGKTKARTQVNTVPDANIPFSGSTGKLSYFDSKIQMPGITGSNVNNLFKDVKQNLRVQVDVPSVSSFDESCDEFTEFQSAPIPSVSTMPIWDSKQGSAIGSRLANHNLGVKKPVDKVKKITVGTKAIHINPQIRTPAPASLPYQSKDQPIVESTDLFPKCGIKNQSKTVILKDTVIRNNDMPKDYSDSFNSLTGMVEPVSSDKEVLPKVELAPKAITVEMSDSVQQDLMSLQQVEDKYSALRELVQETSVVNDMSLDLTFNNQSADEFGEFMSAEQPPNNPTMSDALDIESFSMFADFEFKTHANTDNNNLADLNFVSEVSESFNNLKLDDGIETQFVETGKNVQKEDAISINSIELISGPSEALPRSGSVPSLDLKSFLPSNVEEEQVIETPQQTVYWEWKQYMESCVLLLQVAANIFTNITSELVLQEVLNSAQGYNFLCQLAEVAAVCRRVNFSYKELDINIIGFDDLLMDIDRIWAEMEPFYANIPIVTELPAWPLHQGECISCSLCLTVITSGRVVYNDNNYHVTCANLWLNCVSSQLPVMRYSLLCQSTICPGSHI
ncbi:PREDICTED: synergin gamma-like [Acromyrmex echinatior]|uniref:AP1 subunit gamma-binding protein 1 n=1 Tax=Acromyrmex echinatior TaxID=103372 RepID=F4WBW3_ACREC|nr:PREDICTED: synergin gamma-like [Acromyrmex echinatior]XP_011049951.1 PREDICTED: synergin gamma-like [Acromyrmex echinatior]EGI68391.1 AP1 subunit gamma-binding protein 1 [Acromyrmex echinatior]